MALSELEKQNAAEPDGLTRKQKRIRNYCIMIGAFIALVVVLRIDAFSWDWLAIGSLIIAVLGVVLQYAQRMGEKLDTISTSQETMSLRLGNVESYLKYGRRGKFDG